MPLIGREIRRFASLESTNTLALEFTHDSQLNGLVIVADEQTAGRGQYGRTWQAPPGSSILLSVLLFPPPKLRRPVLLTAWAAVSVCELIQQVTRIPAKIKWPNDVLLQGKKVCGILIEQRTSGNQVATVAGIGLNVNQPREFFEQADLPLGGSLAERTGQSFERDHIFQEIISTLDREYQCILDGETAALEACWKWRLGWLGKSVAVEMHGESAVLRGRLLDATFAAIELVDDRGEKVSVVPERIKHIRPIGHGEP